MNFLLILLVSMTPLVCWGEVDRVTILGRDGKMVGEIAAIEECGAWNEAFNNPETPYHTLTDPVSMPSPLVGVVFWSKGDPVGSAQVLCFDSIVSRESIKKPAADAPIEIPLTYVIGTNKKLTRLVLSFLEKNAKEYLKALDPGRGLNAENLWERAGLTQIEDDSAKIPKSEDIEVYRCESRVGDVLWREKGDEANTTQLNFYRLGKKVGTLTMGEFPLFFKKAKEYDRSFDPFYGPGFDYVLKDSKGNYYIAYFEYEEGHKTFTGGRAAIGTLRAVGNTANVFEGSPHSSGSSATSFDKNFLAQLKAITKKISSDNPGK